MTKRNHINARRVFRMCVNGGGKCSFGYAVQIEKNTRIDCTREYTHSTKERHETEFRERERKGETLEWWLRKRHGKNWVHCSDYKDDGEMNKINHVHAFRLLRLCFIYRIHLLKLQWILPIEILCFFEMCSISIVFAAATTKIARTTHNSFTWNLLRKHLSRLATYRAKWIKCRMYSQIKMTNIFGPFYRQMKFSMFIITIRADKLTSEIS